MTTRVHSTLVAIIFLSGSVSLVLGTSAPALAQPLPVCSAGTCTVTYTQAALDQSWIVPNGVTTESFTLYGAIGGGACGDLGGAGAEVTGTLSLAAGTTVTVDVGDEGMSTC